MPATNAQLKAIKKYKAENAKKINFELSRKTETDLIEWLDSQPNKQGYLKELIRADMARKQGSST